MTDHDFSQLSPHDFERLCGDLLQAEWGVLLESFAEGRDGGIDLRYSRAGAKTVVQCKRYVKSGYAGLIREMRKEAAKVARLAPDRYVLMTAASLTPGNKAELARAVGTRFLAEADVFGRDDVNNLLGRHRNVETAHYKLYLSSIGVLERVLHNDVVTQTGFAVDRIRAEVRKYVQGSAYPRARKALDEDQIAVLSGHPGVGKTTLANLLLYEHVGAGYAPVVIRQNFAEGRRVYKPGQLQVFHFDDFFGVTYLGDRGSDSQRGDHRAIVDFAAMVAADPTKRLILTTREHLLIQARRGSEGLRHSGLLDRRVLIRMGDYDRQQRAEILYNHLFFSELPAGYKAELLRNDFFLKIVDHEKFNPRLIEWLSTYRRVADVPSAEYQGFVERLLADPSEIWRHAYESQISHAGRSFLLALHSLDGKASEVEMETTFRALHERRATRYKLSRHPDDFSAALVELNGAFVRPTAQGGVEFINPSVVDWLNSVLMSGSDDSVDVTMGAISFAQFASVWRLASTKGGGPIRKALRVAGEALPAHLADLATATRGVRLGGGLVKLGMTHERRLGMVLTVAERLRSPGWQVAVTRVADHLLASWSEEDADVADGVDLIKGASSIGPNGPRLPQDFRRIALEAVIASATEGCGSEELVSLGLLLNAEKSTSAPVGETLGGAVHAYLDGPFDDELWECKSNQDYADLRDRLLAMSHIFSIEVDSELAKLDERVTELDEAEQMRADEAYENYRDRRAEEHFADLEIRSMFGSLLADD